MCRVVDTVLVDQETIYAPRYGNDRLLLGRRGASTSTTGFVAPAARFGALEKARPGRSWLWRAVGFVKAGDLMRKIRIGGPGSDQSWCSTRSRTGQCPTRRSAVPRVQPRSAGEQVQTATRPGRRPSYSTIHRIIEKTRSTRRLCLW